MQINHSPWLTNLNQDFAFPSLKQNVSADVTIVGGGIAGVSTANYILKNTNLSVLLLEGGLIANGATGHNAGQVTTYFEKPFVDIVKRYGLKLAGEGQKMVEHAWLLLEEIIQEANLTLPFDQFTGYAGFTSEKQVLHFLADQKEKIQAGLNGEWFYVTKEVEEQFGLKNEFRGLYSLLEHQEILSMLETKNPDYIAAIATRKGCLNSAEFTRELLGSLLSKYRDRLQVFENSHVSSIHMKKGLSDLSVNVHQAQTQKVVLCTNGFENFNILNFDGTQVNTKFHKSVEGVVGFMAGFYTDNLKPPIAISYYPKDTKQDNYGDVYYYLTRRNRVKSDGQDASLICIGGPEYVMSDSQTYRSEIEDHPDAAIDEINGFLQRDFQDSPKNINHEYRWHGLMGYTDTALRVVGRDTTCSNLYYNLGCNGVGILPSIMGGERIARLLNGENLPRSIFDPV